MYSATDFRHQLWKKFRYATEEQDALDQKSPPLGRKRDTGKSKGVLEEEQDDLERERTDDLEEKEQADLERTQRLWEEQRSSLEQEEQDHLEPADRLDPLVISV
jgi:hypothetical protein